MHGPFLLGCASDTWGKEREKGGVEGTNVYRAFTIYHSDRFHGHGGLRGRGKKKKKRRRERYATATTTPIPTREAMEKGRRGKEKEKRLGGMTQSGS